MKTSIKVKNRDALEAKWLMSSARKSRQKIQILNKMMNMHESSFKTRKLQPIYILLLMMEALIIAVLFVPQSNAEATQTLYYDNGEIFGYTSGFIYGVKFSLPAGVSSANISTVRYMWYAAGGTLVIHITGPDHIEELTDPISTTAAVGTEGPGVWNEVDVSNKSIVVSGDFYVAVEKTGEETTGIIMDNSTDGVRSFWGPSMASLTNPSTHNFMIRVVIQPITPPAIPEFPQTTALLTLMIILLGMATLITQQRHKKNQYP